MTKKQRVFAITFVETGNASEAYRQAYDCSRMKQATIKRNAHELLKSNNIATTVKRLKKEEENRLKRKFEINNDKLMREYVKLGFSDIRNLFHEDGRIKSLCELDEDIAAAVGSIEVVTRPGGDDVLEIRRIKLLDKRQPLQDMARMLGMFSEDNAQKRSMESAWTIEPASEEAIDAFIRKLNQLVPDPCADHVEN